MSKATLKMRRTKERINKRTECVTAHVMETGQRRIAVKNLTYKLTAAEKKVLALVSLAKTNKEIASALGIRPATVKRHLENVLRKFELKNRVEAAIYGLIASGCPHDSNSACPLKLWQNGHDAEAKVGHSPKPERWRV